MRGRGRERGVFRVFQTRASRHQAPTFRRDSRGTENPRPPRGASRPDSHRSFGGTRGDRVVSNPEWRGSRHFNLNEKNDGASKYVTKTKGQGPIAPEGPLRKKSFRDLFTDEDLEEKGGGWVEVRRRRSLRKVRDRSPIIKNPCFRCGLGGHFKRNCPKQWNMRCYGCNSSTHQIRNCPVVHRPDELKVEFQTTFDINDRAESLCKFAIFRSKGEVSEGTLRQAMAERYWGPRWEGKIIPIGKFSFLVGFVNEFRRDCAVTDGMINFGGFSGSFMGWSENTGTHQVLRPVIIWITVVGLPLQCWGKEEVSSLTAPFGKLRKISTNFYQKTSADSFKVMVEVEDISVVPKVIKCSYKAVRDNRIRFYNVDLYPSSICLPVSQCNAANYNLYAEEEGSGGCEEEGWSNGSGAVARGVLRDALLQAEAEKEAGMVGGEAEIADPFPAEAEAQFTTAAAHEGGAVFQAHAALSAGERERRRKGKGIAVEEGFKPMNAERILRASPLNSGSGSWDPLNMGGHHEEVGEPLSSKDADSRASFEEHKGREFLPPSLHHPEEDMDLGGDGAMDKQERPKKEEAPITETGKHFAEVAPKKEKGKKVVSEDLLGGNPVIVISDDSEEGRKIEKTTAKNRSQGSNASIPPGFQRIHKPRLPTLPGGSSPFGKMQKGGLRFLKRPSSAASSGARAGSAAPPKKNKPISLMPNQVIGEVARNVGVDQGLTDEQISLLKALEQDRASA